MPESEKEMLTRMAAEEKIREKTDSQGRRWVKVYLGGGSHFKGWLAQIIELKGEENVEVEEVDASGLQCYAESGEKLYRIWTRESHQTP